MDDGKCDKCEKAMQFLLVVVDNFDYGSIKHICLKCIQDGYEGE